MNLRKTTTVCALGAALLLPLSACTDKPADPSAASKGTTLKLASGNEPVEQALAEVYRSGLEALGYSVTLNEPSAAPYRQVLDGKADLAIDQAGMALELAADPAAITGEDQLLSVDEIKQLRTSINDEHDDLEALSLSPANSGKTLVMSKASAAIHEIDSLETLAKACQNLEIITDDPEPAALGTGLEAAGCEQPEITSMDTAQLDDELRASVDSAVVLSEGNAVISDEGFYSIPDSATLFNAEPYMAVAAQGVDEKARGEVDRITSEFSQTALLDLNRMVTDPDALGPEQAATRWEWIIAE